MQRGIITFSTEEQTVLVALLEGTTMASSLVFSRLQATGTSQNAEEKIELSREEAESILDQLPIPSAQEPESVTESRQKLCDFIQNL